MTDATGFAEFLKRVRAGDAAAAEELVRRYEPAIRVAVRANLVDPNLRRHFDTMDVCQSVFCSFFVRAAAGQFEISEPAHLVNLLVKMTRNKVARQARRHHQMKRDARRSVGGDALEAAGDNLASPSQAAMGKELLGAILDRLGAEEREIAQRRAIGQEWADIATEMGGTSEGRRKQLTRALDRVASGLGLEEEEDD